MGVLEKLTKNKIFSEGKVSFCPMSEEQVSLRDEFNKLVLEKKIDFESVDCLCGGSDFSLIASVDRYGLLQDTVMCKSCGLVQSMPRMTSAAYKNFYETDYYRKLYEAGFSGADVDNFFAQSNGDSKTRFEFIKKNLDYPNVKNVLEIGCGGGWNLYPFFRDKKNIEGLDFSHSLVALGQKMGMNIKSGSIADVEGGSFDLVILSHVLEHFLDPVKALRELVSRVGGKAMFYIEVPNIEYFGMAQLQNAHTYYFSPRTLVYYARKAGLGTTRAFQTNITGSHMGGIFSASEGTDGESLSREYAGMKRIIRLCDRKQGIKDFLRSVGVK